MEFDKSKVYTTVNADEVKVGSKGYFADTLSELKNCMSNGRNYRKIKNIANEYNSFRFLDNEDHVWGLFYLVEEPEESEEYRPYENAEEMIEDFKERFKVLNPNYTVPLIWVKGKTSGIKMLINMYKEKKERDGQQTTLIYNDNYFMSLGTLFLTYTYLDGSPCGKKI